MKKKKSELEVDFFGDTAIASTVKASLRPKDEHQGLSYDNCIFAQNKSLYENPYTIFHHLFKQF